MPIRTCGSAPRRRGSQSSVCGWRSWVEDTTVRYAHFFETDLPPRSTGQTVLFSVLLMSFPVAPGTESYQIFGSVIAQAAPWLNVMNLKILHSPAALATPAVSPQNFTAELAVSLRFQPQAWPFGADSSQSAT